MGNKNYTKYSENSNNKTEETVITPEVPTTPEVETTPETTPEIIEKVENLAVDLANQTGEDVTVDVTVGEVPTTPEVEPLPTGVVTGCKQLNVRKEASKDSDVVCVITNGTELTVDVDASTKDFYKVHGSVNEVLFAGYCVKDFIKVNE